MRGSRWTKWVVGILAVIVVLWLGYWLAARYAATYAISRYASGGDTGVECVSPIVRGFPLTLDIRCARLAFDSSDSAVVAGLGGIAARAPLHTPGRVTATLEGPFVINAPDRDLALTASWSLATAEASAWFGGLTGVAASFNSLVAEADGGLPGSRISGVKATTANAAVTPAAGPDFTVTANATGAALTLVDGTVLPAFDAETQVTLVGVGEALGTDPSETIRAWLRSGGTLKVDRLKISAEGAILGADGSLSLSPEGAVNGTLLVRWNDLDALLALVDKVAPGTRAQLEAPVTSLGVRPIDGLSLMSSTVDTPDGKFQQTAITIRRGFVLLGVIPLPVPPLRFQL